MKDREFERIARTYLLPALPGFACRGRLLFAAPISGILRGVLWNRSVSDPFDGELIAFVQPTYIPGSHLVLTYGWELGHGWRLDPSNPHPEIDRILAEMQSVGVALLVKIHNERTFLESIRSRHGAAVSSGVDPNHALRWGATKLLVGDTEESLAILDSAVAEAAKTIDDPPWVYRVAGQCKLLAELAREDPSLAIAQLAEWRRGTLEALKLTPWAVKDWPKPASDENT